MSDYILPVERTRKTSFLYLGIPTIILLLGAALRIAPLTDYRLHPDEALFATLGRLIIAGQDPWLRQTSLLVDKPPLFYYMTASGISVSWASEMAARLPDLFASVISLALLARLARYLWCSQTAAVLSLLVFTLSPFGIAFAPTVFADPQMIMWILAALVALGTRRWGLSGVLYGLALATKQSALFFVPMILALAIAHSGISHTSRRELLHRVGSFGMGLVIIVIAMILWEANRHVSVGFWNAGIEFNNPHRLIRSSELLVRLGEWWHNARYLIASPVLTGMCMASLVAHTLVDIGLARPIRTSKRVFALVLSSFAIAYLAFCWLVAFPVFDRYLLSILPVIALLIGHVLSEAFQYVQNYLGQDYIGISVGLTIFLFALLLPSAIDAASGRIPVGGDHGSYDGIDIVAAYLHDQPSGTVLYSDSLGWSLEYYLFNSETYLAPFGSPDAIKEDLSQFGGGNEQRFLLLPAWQSQIEILTAMGQAGYAATPVIETRNRARESSFVLYRIFPAP